MALKANSKKILDIIAGQSEQNATKAYKQVHPKASDNTARSNSYKLMRKPEAQIYLQKHISQAVKNIVELANDKTVKDSVRLDANRDILDREYGKATIKQDIRSQGITINIDLTANDVTEVDNNIIDN